ncbi:hypothetical protein HDV04_001669 [Boothiomyces sp. JEL0838]|nr:hypothetical protein HDV04_001669 [Boothiomyces sp. JEL0838]
MPVVRFRLAMIVVHLLWSYWLIIYYGINSCLTYMSYYCVFFNASYFVLGYLKNKSPKNGIVRSAFKINYAVTHTVSWVVTTMYWTAVFPHVVSFVKDPLTHILTSVLGHIFNLVFPIVDLYLEHNRMPFIHVLIPLSLFLWYELNMVYQVTFNQEPFPYQWLQTNLTIDGGIDWRFATPFLILLNIFIVGFHCTTIYLSKIFHYSLQDSLEERKPLKGDM